MSQDLISVIIPVYKAAEYLAKRSLSILNQTYPNIEFIFVEDCSPDNTWQVLQELKSAHQDTNIILYHNEQNLGAGPTRNKGLELASGKYVYFADADDEADVNLLQKAYDKLESEQSDVVFFGYKHIIDGQSKEYYLNPALLQAQTINEIKKDPLIVPIAPWGKVVRRSFLLSNNITFPNIRSGQDFCWTIQILRFIQRISIINECLYGYISTANSLSSGKHAKCIVECFLFNKEAISHYPESSLIMDKMFSYLISNYYYYWPRIKEEHKQELANAFFSIPESQNVEKLLTKFLPIEKLPVYKFLPKFIKTRATLKERYYEYKKLRAVLATKVYVAK